MDNSLFESYELDLLTLLSSLNSKLTKEILLESGDKRKGLLKRIEAELDESDEIISQMEIEVQTTSRENKVSLLPKMKEYKLTLARNKVELKVLLATADRDDLLSTTTTSPHTILEMDSLRSQSDSPSSQAQAQRTRLLNATDKLTDGQRRLEESHRVALETEDLGTDILRDLRGQRDQLEHTRDNLYEADGSIDRASNTLRKMVRTMYQQRLVTYAIIAILVLLIGYVLFSKIF